MRLIDADELLKYANGEITSAFAYPQGQRADEEKAYREMWSNIRKILLSAPTIEATPLKHGADDGLIFKDTARRIIDSPRSKSQMLSVLKSLPTIEAEPTFEQIEEYCRKRCLVVVDVALFNEMKSRWSAEPRKHGHWIWRGGNLYECSECGAIVVAQDYIPIGLHYFCRGCGADMRGSKDE